MTIGSEAVEEIMDERLSRDEDDDGLLPVQEFVDVMTTTDERHVSEPTATISEQNLRKEIAASNAIVLRAHKSCNLSGSRFEKTKGSKGRLPVFLRGGARDRIFVRSSGKDIGAGVPATCSDRACPGVNGNASSQQPRKRDDIRSV